MKALKWIERNFELVFLIFFLVLISVLLMLQVILRYCFDSGVNWFDEVSRFSFVISVFLGASYSIRYDIVFRMTGILDRIPLRTRFVLEIIIDIGTFLFFAFLSYHCAGVVGFMNRTGTLSGVIRMPMKYLYLAVDISLFVGALRCVQKTVNDVKAGPEKFSSNQSEIEAGRALESEGIEK